MQPRLLKTSYAQYVPAEWGGQNLSGWNAYGDRILVLTDRAPETTGGNIMLPESIRQNHDEAAITGVLIACGSDAFVWNSDRSRRLEGDKPMPGDRIMFQKYAGELLFGEDDQLYRVMEDRAIGAIMRRAA